MTHPHVRENAMSENKTARRRGFLKTLGLASAAGVVAAEAEEPQRADAVPPGAARKENEADRLKARYRADSPDVQAFYRTNRY